MFGSFGLILSILVVEPCTYRHFALFRPRWNDRAGHDDFVALDVALWLGVAHLGGLGGAVKHPSRLV